MGIRWVASTGEGTGTSVIEHAAHTAYLNVLTGDGILLLPRPANDVWLGWSSLFTADWDATIAHLFTLGWAPTPGEDDDHLPLIVGRTADGRYAIALLGDELVMSEVGLMDSEESFAALAGLAGVGLI